MNTNLNGIYTFQRILSNSRLIKLRAYGTKIFSDAAEFGILAEPECQIQPHQQSILPLHGKNVD
jgi:hypothetical protein